MVDCCRLADDREIAAGTDRDLMADHAIAQILDIVLLESQAVEILVLTPLFQFNDQVYILTVAHARHAEQRLDVYNSDASELDQVLGDLGRRSDQCVLAHLADLHHVVGDQSVPSLDQLVCALS